MKSFAIMVVLALSVVTVGQARADWPVGLWQTAPNLRGDVVHVRAKLCGASICGRIERAKDRRGYDRPSSFVGRRMLFNLTAQQDGSYLGDIWEPELNRIVSARMRVSGDRMYVRGCDDMQCRDVVWTRVR